MKVFIIVHNHQLSSRKIVNPSIESSSEEDTYVPTKPLYILLVFQNQK